MMTPLSSYNKIEWMTSPYFVPYPDALAKMEERVKAIAKVQAPGCIWLLEHPPLITLGTSGRQEDILDTTLPVYVSGRGGKATFHGPGQRVVYVMLDLKAYGCDIKKFVRFLERWILLTLKTFSLEGFTDPNRVGVWIATPQGDQKIASIGVRVRQWISFHGFALNVHPDLKYFQSIIPCGLASSRMCSLQSLGLSVSLQDVDQALQQTFDQAL